MSKHEKETESAVAQALTAETDEDQGCDAPFASFTWEQWLEMQAQMMQRFTRFQRAVQYKQAKVAAQVAQEVIVMGMLWLEEATGWIGVEPV